MAIQLLIRVDSNPEIASGHLMRCLSVAAEAKSQGLEVVFLMSDDCNREIVEKRGFSYCNLKTNWKNLDSEISDLLYLINKYHNPILLIDTYSITASYVSALQQSLPIVYLGSKMINIGQPNGIINYNSAIDYDYYNSHHCNSELLLGVKYAPLRKEFHNSKVTNISVLTDLLLTTGGTDKPNFSEHFIKTNLKLFEKYNLTCHVIVGSMFHNVSTLECYANHVPHIALHHNVDNMSTFMRKCQLAISANGTTVYELAACGIPTISFALVKEQEISGKTLGDMGIVDYSGLYPDNTTKCMTTISKKIENYINNPTTRIQLGERASSIIDGKGCEYIVNSIIKIRNKWS